MKSSNKVSIQKAFIQQVTGFEGGRMNFSSKDKLCRISDQTAADGCGAGGCHRNLRLQTCACPLAGNVVCLDMTSAMLSVGKAEAEKANLSKYDVCTGRCYGASVFGQ